MTGQERGSPEHDELRQLLLERRKRAKLSQRELAARLGWDQKIISNLERGSKRLTVLELIEIARYLSSTRPLRSGGSPRSRSGAAEYLGP
jgi:transcriptional regulator with XRE-family HTH domain